MSFLDETGLAYFWKKVKEKFIKKSDALSYEEIQASTDLTEKIGSAEALKKAIVKEKVYTNIRTDSLGRAFIGAKCDDFFVLSANANDYVVDISITSRGDNYFFIVKTRDGALVKETTIPAIYQHYVER